MKNFLIIFYILFSALGNIATAQEKKFSGFSDDAEYQFSVKERNNTLSDGSVAVIDEIVFVVYHRTGTPLGGGTLSLPTTETGGKYRVKSIKISGDILTVKTKEGNRYHYLIENYTFKPMF